MSRLNIAHYDFSDLTQAFVIATVEGECRLLHKNDKICPRNGIVVAPRGSLADTYIANRGYRVCRRGQLRLLVHVVIWTLNAGRSVQPGLVIDHIDRDKLNNCPANLREVRQRDNIINTRPCDDRLIGVHSTKSNRYTALAHAPSSNRQTYLGTFDRPEAAAAAYDQFIWSNYGPSAASNFSLGRLGEI